MGEPVAVLCGGLGGSRLVHAISLAIGAEHVTAIGNVGDDLEFLGLHVSPDLDTVLYTLSGLLDEERGWGRADETWTFMRTLRSLGGEDWFQLGDGDLATHVLRTHALRRGAALSQVTADLARRLGVRHAVIPMSETPVRTRVKTPRGELAFQDYFVRLKCKPRVLGFRFTGASIARAPAELVAAGW